LQTADDRAEAMLFNLPVHIDGLKSILCYVSQIGTSRLAINDDYNLDVFIRHRRSFRTRCVTSCSKV